MFRTYWCYVFIALLVCFNKQGHSQNAGSFRLSMQQRANAHEPLTISADIFPELETKQFFLAYRLSGEQPFKQIEMRVAEHKVSATIPAEEVVEPLLEYYFVVHGTGDSLSTIPEIDPEHTPFSLPIQRSQTPWKIIFLSPDADSSTPDDFFVSISFLHFDPPLDSGNVTLLIDGVDVSSFAKMNGDILTLLPENISPPLNNGPHTILIQVRDAQQTVVANQEQSFSLRTIGEKSMPSENIHYNASAQVETRTEKIREVSSTYNRANVTVGSQYKSLSINGHVYVSNEEKYTQQSQNRYAVEIDAPYVHVGLGDVYPVFPLFVLNSKRVRGISTQVKFGFFNLDFTTGSIQEKKEGDTVRTFPDSLSNTIPNPLSLPIGTYDASKKLSAMYKYYGTYQRNITAIRPSFGRGESFQWGLTVMKAKDDITSIRFGNQPKENLVVGSDIYWGFDNRHIEFAGQYAASVVNTDISGGSIADSVIDKLFDTDRDSIKKRNDLKKIRDLVSKIITVNQYLIPLSADNLTSIMSYEGSVALNYFDNYLKGAYIFRGKSYNSFGQSFARTDVRGVTAYDRVRLLQNQLFVSAGVERLNDNTDNANPFTTTFWNINSSVSYFPRIDIPSITLGYTRNLVTNGRFGFIPVTPADTIRFNNSFAREDVNNRYFVQANYEFNYYYRHNATIDVSTSKKDDQVNVTGNISNTTITTSISTTWTTDLQSSVAVSLNNNIFPQQTFTTPPVTVQTTFDYVTSLYTLRYQMFDKKLFLTGYVNSSLGDVVRTVFDVDGEYFIIPTCSISATLQMIRTKNVSTDLISGLTAKYTL